MYFYKIDSSSFGKLQSEIRENTALSSLYESLKNHAFDIFYKFQKDGDGKITYYAIRKEKGQPRYLSFRLGTNKEVDEYSSENYFNNVPASKALAFYIMERDMDADEATLQRRYHSDYSRLYAFASLTKNEAKKMAEAKESFLSLRKDLLKSFRARMKKKLHIDYMFYFERGATFSLKLRAGIDKKYAIKDLPFFFSSLLADEAIPLGKEMVSSDEYELDENERLALRFLSSRLSFVYGKEEGFLNESDFVSVLFLLTKQVIQLDEKKYEVPEPEEESASISKEGQISTSISISKEERFFSTGKKALTINENEATLRLFSFSSESEGTLASFAITHQDFPYFFLADEIGEEIVPLLEPKTKVDEDFLKTHPSGQAEIHYTITYLDNETLTFKTQYFVSLHEIDEESFKNCSESNALRLKRFENELLALSLPKNGFLEKEDDIVLFLASDLSRLNETCSLFLSENLANKNLQRVRDIHIATKSGEDWFSASLESITYSEEELLAIYEGYRKQKKYVRFHGSFLFLDQNSEIAEVAKDFAPEDIGEKLPLYQALKLNVKHGENEVLSNRLVTMLKDLTNYSSVSLERLGPELFEILRPYQKDGVRWLLVHDHYELGGLLADEMGLGKTLETIAFLSLSKEEEPILIVSPKSLIFNWASEFHRFDPKRKVNVICGTIEEREKVIRRMKKSKNEVFIGSYDSLRNDFEKYKDISFSYLFLDEAQFIANAFAKKSKAVKGLAAKHRFALTGTPIQNNLLDLWSIFDFLLPGYLPSFKNFKYEYGELTYQNEESEMRLKRKIAPFFLQRKKNEVLSELPPKEERQLIIDLTEEQRKIYESYLLEARALLKGTKENYEVKKRDERQSKFALLAALTRLRQICVDPSMFLEDVDYGAKFSTLIVTIKTALHEGHKVIVFSSFVKALSHLEELLLSEGIGSYFIYGSVSAEDRLLMANLFNEKEEKKVMLVSLKAGGTGLNLIGADIVYHLDPWWNLAVEEQASDRAHRLGQTRKVTVYKMIAKNTIEEKVLNLQEKKKDLSSVLTQDDSFSSMTDEDIDYLLS